MKKIVGAVVVVGMSLSSMGYAFEDGPRRKADFRPPRQEILNRLPADKEMLFHQTMREAREKMSGIRESIKGLRAEIEDVLTANEFDEALFRAKMQRMHELREMRHEAMNEAIIKLAKRFTQEERKILAEMIPQKRGRHGRPSAR